MQLSSNSTVTLSNGVEMPRIGYGLYLSAHAEEDVKEALANGYLHCDSAQYYENEAEAGKAIRASSIKRKKIFLTSKTFGAKTADESYKLVHESIDKANTDGYLDLFLIHAPSGGTEHRKTVWQALERLHAEGKLKSIGVSNYGVKHLEEIKTYAKTMPVVNQIELHPWCQQRDIVAKCKEMDIVVQAYCPLVRNEKAEVPTLCTIAKKYNKQTAQVLIRWSLQKGYVPLPKSSTPARIKSNIDVYDFNLDDGDMEALDKLEADYHVAPNVVNCD